MKCPICRKEITRETTEFPFCSERCRVIDLGNWASGKYVISTPLGPGDRPKNPDADQDED